MRLKHAFQVFIDNFATTYKLLIYRLIVTALVVGLGCAVVIPSINVVVHTTQYADVSDAFAAFWDSVTKLDFSTLSTQFETLKSSLSALRDLLVEEAWLIAVDVICMAIVLLIYMFLLAVGEYVTGELIKHKMTLRADTSFTITLLKNLKRACLYAVIYAPISFLYYAVSATFIWALVFVGLGFASPLIKLFLTAVLLIVLFSVKFTFMTDWLPSMLHAKMSNRKSIAYALQLKNKAPAGTMSSAIVMAVLVLAINISVPLFTFGAGLLLTIPAGAMIFTSYQFINYYDNNGLKYFIDEYTIVGPKKDAPISREEFFKGDDK
ncbi:MAG: hypothetical protein K2N47_01305 [Clostridia bacterium]|nr:hypothetical protein [Clostridia bacterium]